MPGGPKDRGATDDETDRMVAARMRCAVLYDPGRQRTLIVGEAALHNQVGSRDVMDEQRDHIACVASPARISATRDDAARPCRLITEASGSQPTR
ncbi:MAG: Scr1 family TA system antitoxin-like transcriptional regulator [Nocardioidaceae bacterium]